MNNNQYAEAIHLNSVLAPCLRLQPILIVILSLYQAHSSNSFAMPISTNSGLVLLSLRTRISPFPTTPLLIQIHIISSSNVHHVISPYNVSIFTWGGTTSDSEAHSWQCTYTYIDTDLIKHVDPGMLTSRP